MFFFFYFCKTSVSFHVHVLEIPFGINKYLYISIFWIFHTMSVLFFCDNSAPWATPPLKKRVWKHNEI